MQARSLYASTKGRMIFPARKNFNICSVPRVLILVIENREIVEIWGHVTRHTVTEQ